mmetsp:Transcript_6653/g.20216  ORF Transcript_6653/g.20216 Transcript_6653/m.20216 type:complete len:218 (-) Transcript_6653:337-990(-)
MLSTPLDSSAAPGMLPQAPTLTLDRRLANSGFRPLPSCQPRARRDSSAAFAHAAAQPLRLSGLPLAPSSLARAAAPGGPGATNAEATTSPRSLPAAWRRMPALVQSHQQGPPMRRQHRLQTCCGHIPRAPGKGCPTSWRHHASPAPTSYVLRRPPPLSTSARRQAGDVPAQSHQLDAPCDSTVTFRQAAAAAIIAPITIAKRTLSRESCAVSCADLP